MCDDVKIEFVDEIMKRHLVANYPISCDHINCDKLIENEKYVFIDDRRSDIETFMYCLDCAKKMLKDKVERYKMLIKVIKSIKEKQ